MAYSNRFVKGRVGYSGTWPLVVVERARSDKPLTPVLCEVWGFEHESGSVYLKDIRLAGSLESWKADRSGQPDGNSIYFKGELSAVSA